MTTVAKQFMEQLKQDNVLEAIEVIKSALFAEAQSQIQTVNDQVAESYKMKKKIKEEDEDDKEDDKSDEDDSSEDEDEEDEDDEDK